MGEGIDQIVPVQLLPRLLRTDGDGRSGGKLMAGAVGSEHRIVEGFDRRMEGERARGWGIDQDRVRAPGLVAHELAGPGGRACDVRCQVGGDGVHGRRVGEVLQDHAPVAHEHVQNLVRRRRSGQ